MGRCQHLSNAKAHCKFINKKWNGIWVSKWTQQPIISLKNYCKNVTFSSIHSFFGKMHSESLSPITGLAQERAVTLARSLCYAWPSQIRGSEKSQLVCCPGHTHTVRGRAEDPGSVTSGPPCCFHQSTVLGIYLIYLISVSATSWVIHRRVGGQFGQLGNSPPKSWGPWLSLV